MTCIVGIAHQRSVYMGADSAASDSRHALTVRADKKLFKNGPFLMGFTSSYRMGQLLEFSLDAPQPREGVDLYAYMVTDFIDAVRSCLKTGGYASRVNENEQGGEFLVGTRGRLFRIYQDYQVEESSHGFNACGCGDLIALGSLYSTIGATAPIIRIDIALRAAEQFSSGVRGPLHVDLIEALSP